MYFYIDSHRYVFVSPYGFTNSQCVRDHVIILMLEKLWVAVYIYVWAVVHFGVLVVVRKRVFVSERGPIITLVSGVGWLNR